MKKRTLFSSLMTTLAVAGGAFLPLYAHAITPLAPIALQGDTEIGRTFRLTNAKVDVATTFDTLDNLFVYRFIIGDGAKRLEGQSDASLKSFGFTWSDLKFDAERRKEVLSEAIAQNHVGTADGQVRVRILAKRQWKHRYDIKLNEIERWVDSKKKGGMYAYQIQFLEGNLKGETRWVTTDLGRDLESQSGEQAFKSLTADGDLVLPQATKAAVTPVVAPVETFVASDPSTTTANAIQPFTLLASFTTPFVSGVKKGMALVVVTHFGEAGSIDVQYLREENGRMVAFDQESIDDLQGLAAFVSTLDTVRPAKRPRGSYTYYYPANASISLKKSTASFLTKQTLSSAPLSARSDTSSTTDAPPSLQYNGSVHVKGYTRKDGTYVRPHTRSAPGSGRRKR